MSLINIFRREFPTDLMKFITGGLRDCYPAAHAACIDLFDDKDVRNNSYPWIRRGKIEDMLLAVATEYGLPVTAKQVSSQFFWHHVEVQSGSVILTQCAAVKEDAPIRSASYKNDLAKLTQGLLFPEVNTADCDKRLYAMLLHNKSRINSDQIGFAPIRFPKVDKKGILSGFHEGHIDLMDEFLELFVESASHPRTEEIADEAYPILLHRKASGSK